MKIVSKLALIVAAMAMSALVGCATGPADSSLVKTRASQPAIVAVAKPGHRISAGATFSWLPEAIAFYSDQRLQNSSIQYAIEREIKHNLHEMGYGFIGPEARPGYRIAYTAALESSLGDNEIMSRFGLLPGMGRGPANQAVYEKGSLIIYVLDTTGRFVLWRSAVQAAVDFSASTEAREQRLSTIVKSMFQSFPGSGG